MSDPRFPNRPEHPDFWLISEVLVGGDAAEDNETIPFDDHVQQVVDLPSAMYAARGQAAMFMDRSDAGLVLGRKQAEMMIQAAWLTAFQYGARFQQLKSAGKIATDEEPVVEILVSRSAGADGAVLVMIDTHEHHGVPSRPIRILLNDEPVFADVDYQATEATEAGADHGERHAGEVSFDVYESQIKYKEEDHG